MKNLLRKFLQTKTAKAKLPNIVSEIFDTSIFNPKNIDKNTKQPQNNTQDRTFGKVVNTNSAPMDFPGLQGMPTPDPSNYLHISTGNGKGGEIISRPQVKFSSSLFGLSDINYTGRNRDEDELIPEYYDPEREKRNRILKAVEDLNPYNPLHYMGKFTTGPVSGLASGAATGALLGVLPGMAYNWMKKTPGSYTSAALGGAGLGAAILAAAGLLMGSDKANAAKINEALKKYSSTKYAFGMHGNDLATRQLLESKIMSDMSLDFGQKSALISYIKTLNPNAINQLSPLTTGLIGSGIGAAIANKLLGLGYTGTILFGILGGLIGANVNNNPQPIVPNLLANHGFRDSNGRLI